MLYLVASESWWQAPEKTLTVLLHICVAVEAYFVILSICCDSLCHIIAKTTRHQHKVVAPVISENWTNLESYGISYEHTDWNERRKNRAKLRIERIRVKVACCLRILINVIN